MSRPQVSVVLPAYNAERFLQASVQSILQQSFTDLELIAVDDGSTDRSGAILDEWARQDARLRVIHQPNRGQPAAMNTAIAQAQAPLIARMDADDIALPRRLQRQVDFLAAHPQVVVVGTWAWNWAGGATVGSTIRLPHEPAVIGQRLPQVNGLMHPTVLMRRDAFAAAGGYRPLLAPAEDYDLWLRMLGHGELANLPEAHLLYRVHAGQLSVASGQKQAYAALAAQAAHRMRLTTGRDPLDSLSKLDEATLRNLGISADAIARTMAEQERAWPIKLLDIADAAAEPELADALRRSCRSLNERRWAEGMIAWLGTVRRLRDGQRMRALASLLRAVMFCPGLLLCLHQHLADLRAERRSREYAEALAACRGMAVKS